MDNFLKSIILLNMPQDMSYIILKTLLDEFGSPEAIFSAPKNKLIKLSGISGTVAESIINANTRYDIDKELLLIEKQRAKVVTIFDKDYPEALKNIYNPPILLYIKGDLNKEDEIALAIVGSRRASCYGLRTAENFASQLSALGITIVSGLARGIDTAAHRGAVKNKGRTLAVLGNGLSSIYPAENRKLADAIAENGALISEFPMQTPPHKWNFPRRNRIISGISRAVLIVEAAKKSGALITADLALEEGKEVFAVPGPAGSVTSEGTNNLIKDGARLVDNIDDILDGLGVSLNRRQDEKKPFSDPRHKDIYNLLSDEPRDIDDIMGSLSYNPKELKAILLSLVMKGFIKELPGKLYVKS